jgi:hypothetical protein
LLVRFYALLNNNSCSITIQEKVKSISTMILLLHKIKKTTTTTNFIQNNLISALIFVVVVVFYCYNQHNAFNLSKRKEQGCGTLSISKSTIIL